MALSQDYPAERPAERSEFYQNFGESHLNLGSARSGEPPESLPVGIAVGRSPADNTIAGTHAVSSRSQGT